MTWQDVPPGDPLWGRAFAAAVDHASSKHFLIPSPVLMESAGRAIADQVLTRIGSHAQSQNPVLVLAGPGNNGGDALVAARYLLEAGIPTHIVTLPPQRDGKRSDGCTLQLQILTRLGYSVAAYAKHSLSTWRASLPDTHVWVLDGLLGLGGRADIPETSALGTALCEAASLANKTVIAVDLPSGLDCDDGGQQKVWLPADVTVTFGGLKPALVLSPARDLCGEVVVCEIGFPKKAVERATGEHPPLWLLPDAHALLRASPWRSLKPSAHKYDRGHVLIIGGSPGKTGAPLLAAMSALRCGAGWATVSMPKDAFDSLRGEVPREIVFEDLFEDASGANAKISPLKLLSFLAKGRVKAVVIGPGTMMTPLNSASLSIIKEFCLHDGFAVCDAGACHDLAPLLEMEPNKSPCQLRWVMTPHPGEWTKLGLADKTPPLTPEQCQKAQATAAQLGMSMLYKSATPMLFLGRPGAPALVSVSGSKVLARAGSGDVLAGAIGAHGAMGLDVAASVMRSQTVLGHAAHLAALRLGHDGVLAQDVIHDLGRIPTS